MSFKYAVTYTAVDVASERRATYHARIEHHENDARLVVGSLERSIDSLEVEKFLDGGVVQFGNKWLMIEEA